MRRSLVLATILAALTLYSCGKNDTTPTSGGQHATITMKDGTTAAGSVMSSSKNDITIAGDDKITRTIPMDQVRSIEYGDAAPATPAAAPVAASALPDQPAHTPTDKANTAAPAVPESQPSVVHPPQPSYELPAGTKVAVRTDEGIDSATASEGRIFPGEVTKDVPDAVGNIVIPARSSAEIVIRSASKGGKIRGASDLVLDLKSVMIGGKRYRIETADINKVGNAGIGANKRTATYTGGGTAIGAIIGAIAGGGKGAAIGALSGAGAGAATQTLTKGSSIKVPAETILTFQLDQPLRVAAEQ